MSYFSQQALLFNEFLCILDQQQTFHPFTSYIILST